MEESAWKILSSDLKMLCVRVLENCGVLTGDAELVADALVQANLRGVDTHGVRLLPTYAPRLKAGDIFASSATWMRSRPRKRLSSSFGIPWSPP